MLYDDIVISGARAMARSYAKINLTLDVLNKRSDGYHDVEMIMQTVSLYDLIIIDKIDEGIEITTNLNQDHFVTLFGGTVHDGLDPGGLLLQAVELTLYFLSGDQVALIVGLQAAILKFHFLISP